jgi:hypothetical protein
MPFAPTPLPISLLRLALVPAWIAATGAGLGCAAHHAELPAARAATDVPIELTLPSVKGEPLDLATLRGQVVLIDVMATWSVAAQSQLPLFRKLLATYGERGLRVVSIAVDGQLPQLVRTYVDTLEIDWTVGLGDAELVQGGSPLGRILEVPRTVILDRRGFVRFDRSGVLSGPVLAAAIEPLL